MRKRFISRLVTSKIILGLVLIVVVWIITFFELNNLRASTDIVSNRSVSNLSLVLNVVFSFLSISILLFLYYINKTAKEQELNYRTLEIEKNKIQNIINATNAATWEWNYQTKEIIINENYAEICGYGLYELLPMTQDKWESLIHPDDLEKTRKAIQDHIKGVISVLDYECRVLHKNGNIMWFHVRGKIVNRDVNGNPVWIYGVDRDITETKNAQNIDNQFQKLETVGVLAGGIAHEFNNILTGVYGFIELAMLKVQDEKVIKYLQSSVTSINRAKLISNKLLTFSEGGKIVITCQQIEFFLRNAITNIINDRAYSISFHNFTDLWPVFFDRNQIYNVLMNILQNSMEAMPNGGHITIITENKNIKKHKILDVGKYVKVSIIDHGDAIPDDVINRIFDPFFTTKPKHQGLGLTLSFGIVKKHNGCIEVESSEIGSTFNLYLPADHYKDNLDDEINKNPSGMILILEEDDASRDVFIQILSVLGYDVMISYQPEQTLSLLKQNRDKNLLAILINLSSLKKYEHNKIMDTFKDFDDNIPVFVTSSDHSDPIMQNPKKHRFTDCIKKPFTLFDIEEKLSKINSHET